MTLKEFKNLELLLLGENEDFQMGLATAEHLYKEKKCTKIHLYFLARCLQFNRNREAFINQLKLSKDVKKSIKTLIDLSGMQRKKDKNLSKIAEYIIAKLLKRLTKYSGLDILIADIKITLK